MVSIAYKRVSSLGQSDDRQLDGMTFYKEFTEKVSGGSTANRPKLEEMIGFARDGDVVHVHDISRLARNVGDLIAIVKQLNAKGVSIKFHKENLTFGADIANPMNELMLSVLGAVHQFGKDIINQAADEGRAAAVKAGKHIGRVAALTAEQQEEIKTRLANGENKATLALEYGVSRATIYNTISRTTEAQTKIQKAVKAK